MHLVVLQEYNDFPVESLKVNFQCKTLLLFFFFFFGFLHIVQASPLLPSQFLEPSNNHFFIVAQLDYGEVSKKEKEEYKICLCAFALNPSLLEGER